MHVTIDISEVGAVRMSVDGVVIGMIEELTLVAVGDGHPKLKIRMLNVDKFSEDEKTKHIKQVLNRYRSVLGSIPWVELFDQADTVPGMPAVRLEEG